MSGYYPQHNDPPQAYEPMVSPSSAAGNGIGPVSSLGTGIWVFATRKTTPKAPLIAGAVVAGIAVVLLLLGLATTTAASRVPHYGSLAVNLRAIAALRIRPVPAAAPAGRF